MGDLASIAFCSFLRISTILWIFSLLFLEKGRLFLAILEAVDLDVDGVDDFVDLDDFDEDGVVFVDDILVEGVDPLGVPLDDDGVDNLFDGVETLGVDEVFLGVEEGVLVIEFDARDLVVLMGVTGFLDGDPF